MSKFLLIRLLIALTVILISLTAGVGQEKAGDLKIEPYVFENSNQEKVAAELGHLRVPENRSNPHSALIELAFVRFKSTAAKPGPPIIYLAGGPGGSGISAARGPRFPLFMAMRAIADVIALDQRGVGMSKPNLNCSETIDFPLDKEPGREVLLQIFRSQSRSCVARLRAQGVDLAGYNTNESADDLEALRKAIGAKKISLWGISYGTHLALATIRRHESRIERMILAGVEGPSQTIKLPSNIQNHLVEIDRLVKQDPELSKAIPSFLGLMKTVFDRVEREPVKVEVSDPRTEQKAEATINKFVLQMLTVNLFGGGEATLPAQYYALSQGNWSLAAQAWLRLAGSRQALGSAMAYMMDCSSGVSPERRRKIKQEAGKTLLGDLIDLPQPDVCDAWGNPDLGAKFRSSVKSRVPVLFISGSFDVRTPVSNAEEVRRGFPNSRHLIIKGAVHSDPLFLSSPQIKDVMLAFMRGAPLPIERIVLPRIQFQKINK